MQLVRIPGAASSGGASKEARHVHSSPDTTRLCLGQPLKITWNSCFLPEAPEDNAIARLLERISELEQENASLMRLDETIRRNVHLFEALLNQSYDSILLLTPEMTIFRLVHSVLGYREDQLLGESQLSFIHPEDAPAFQVAFSKLMEGKESTVTLECRVRSAAGLWTWFEMRLTDLLNDPDIQAIVMNGRRIVFGPIGQARVSFRCSLGRHAVSPDRENACSHRSGRRNHGKVRPKRWRWSRSFQQPTSTPAAIAEIVIGAAMALRTLLCHLALLV